MKRIVRVALTETKNAYGPMPSAVDRLDELTSKLDDVRAANIDHHRELVREAAGHRVQIIGFGELFPAPFFALGQNPMWLALAEDAEDGPTIAAFRQVARDHRILIAAPIYERCADETRYNTTVIIDEGGTVIGKYRKCHLPQGSNEQGSFDEPFYYSRSNGDNGDWPANVSGNPFFPVYQTSLCKLGIATCYDRHFPGVMKSLADEGAELVLSPAVTFGSKSRRMWHMEFEVDAARYNLVIGGSNRKGAEPPWNQEYFGESYFTGPNGRYLPLAGLRPELVVADVDLDDLTRPDPSGWNLRRDLRPDIYSK